MESFATLVFGCTAKAISSDLFCADCPVLLQIPGIVNSTQQFQKESTFLSSPDSNPIGYCPLALNIIIWPPEGITSSNRMADESVKWPTTQGEEERRSP